MLDVAYSHPVGDAVKTDFSSEDQRLKYEKAIGPEAFAAAMRVRDRLVGESGRTGLYMCHGFCELEAMPFDSALAQVRAFLVAHPSEVVVLVIEDYVAPADIAAAAERRGPVTPRGQRPRARSAAALSCGPAGLPGAAMMRRSAISRACRGRFRRR